MKQWSKWRRSEPEIKRRIISAMGMALVLFAGYARADFAQPRTVWLSHPDQKEFATAEEAARAGVANWCLEPVNSGFYTTCGYAGLRSSDNIAAVATNQGTFWIIPVAGPFLRCPTGYQLGDWFDGTTTHRRMCWAPSPPPPPPPPKKVIALDPGHGFTCPSRGMKVGAVGVTDFPTSNPPAGRLQEDSLTVAFALEAERLLSANYKVVLTKRSANACPTFLDRGRIANNANARVFVSVHVNAPSFFSSGTSSLYNRDKGAFDLAYALSEKVAQALGLNNRGPMPDDEIAVLKPTVTHMDAALLEAGRLSGHDEQVLHSREAPGRVASGIRAAIIDYVGF